MRSKSKAAKPQKGKVKQMGLSTGAMPKSNAGRKADPLNDSLVSAIVEYLQETPLVETEDFVSPAFIGPDDHLFEKETRAQAQGRKYAKVISEKIGRTVSVNVYPQEMDSAGKPAKDSKYLWRVYTPLSAFNEEETKAILARNSDAEESDDSAEAAA